MILSGSVAAGCSFTFVVALCGNLYDSRPTTFLLILNIMAPNGELTK